MYNMLWTTRAFTLRRVGRHDVVVHDVDVRSRDVTLFEFYTFYAGG
jgi:hypothetical protein